MRRLAFALTLVAACSRSQPSPPNAPAAPSLPAAGLAFSIEGRKLADLSPERLAAVAPPEELSVWDPYYRKAKRYRALPLAPIVRAAFSSEKRRLEDLDFVLRARDGFTVPYAGARLLGGGGYVAFADLDVPGWEPIGEQRANPGPFYVVWTRPEQQALEDWPRPWQLASIEIARVEDLFPHALPTGDPDGSAAWRGFATFRQRCILCHAVNREGGRVGPDLNVPQSIVEYRPTAQIKQYVRDPQSFRYGHMPSHPDLADAALDDLLAYFTAMSTRKHDPDARAASPPVGADAGRAAAKTP